MNTAREALVDAMSDHLVWVGPGSEKPQPPTLIKIFRAGLLAFSLPIRPIRGRSLNVNLKSADISAKATFICVNACDGIFSGGKPSQSEAAFHVS